MDARVKPAHDEGEDGLPVKPGNDAMARAPRLTQS
jgi:hypothetical protein